MNIMKRICIFCFIVNFFFCISITAQEPFQSPKLIKVWELKSGLNVPESAFFNPNDKTIYVSNIVGKFDAKDSIGYISKINLKGEMIQKEWVKGLNGPKGMHFTKTKLFITDEDRVLEIGVPSGKIIKEYKNPLSKDLNDITIAENGKVYVSDSGSDCLFVVGKNALEVFIQSPEIKGMNGIFSDGNNIYIGAGGKLLSIDANTKSITVLATDAGYMDGLLKINKNTFITSNLSNTIQLIVLGKTPEKLLVSKIHAADLGYIPSLKLLLVPTFSENQLVAYKLELDK
jgi:DNA-binding beta-propeller fold protein YncE